GWGRGGGGRGGGRGGGEGGSGEGGWRRRGALATRASSECAAAWVGGRSRIAASLSEAWNRWRVAATRAARRAPVVWQSRVPRQAAISARLRAYCLAMARENSPLRMRPARPSAKPAAAPSP